MTVFIVKEDGQYKVLDSLDKPNSIALEMMDRVNAGDLKGKGAAGLVARGSAPRGRRRSAGRPRVPRVWIKGEAADARKMKLAAAAIMVDTSPRSRKALRFLRRA